MDKNALASHRREYEEFQRLFGVSRAEREVRMVELAHNDPQLAIDVLGLLTDADAERAIESNEVESANEDCVGQLIGGRFRLLRPLGAGGMGDVYLADRVDDVHQQVVVKIVGAGMSLSRAHRERQILAKLSHPHIASLVDTGRMPSGQPWFAMDYVEGERITDWCDRNALGLAARVRVLAQVARAVQFAHKNLILHRDLIPSNILVDTAGTPRLFDFGIAKFLDATDAQEAQTLAMTPAYASPEQLRGETATTSSEAFIPFSQPAEAISTSNPRLMSVAVQMDETRTPHSTKGNRHSLIGLCAGKARVCYRDSAAELLDWRRPSLPNE